MENSITIFESRVDLVPLSTKDIAPHAFKSEEVKHQVTAISSAIAKVNSAAGKLRDEYDRAKDAAYKEIAPIVASLKARKVWKDEGFKTWTDFVDTCLPISSRQASTLLAYQKKVADVPALKEFTVAKVEAIAPADAVAINNALESGELSADTALDDLQLFAKANPRTESGSGRPSVLPEFTVKAVLSGTVIAERAIKEDFAKVTGNSHIVMLQKPKDGAPRRFISYNDDGGAAMYEFTPYIKPNTEPKPKARDKSVYDTLREQFDYMADWSDEEIAAVLRAHADGAKGK